MKIAIRVQLVLFLLLISVPGKAMSADLVSLLTDQLGITQQQAKGGAGTIFQAAKPNMSSSEFSQLAGIVPNMGDLLAAAPQVAGTSSAGNLVGGLLGGGEKSAASQLVGQLGEMTGAFAMLGLSSDQVTPFVDIVLNYVNSEGGSGMMTTLQSALGMKTTPKKQEEDLVTKGLGKLLGG